MKTSKKIIIFLLIAFGYSVITVGLNFMGIQLGALPAIILLVLAIALYRMITKDRSETATPEKTESANVSETDENENVKKMFDDYMKPEYFSKRIFTNENKIITNIDKPISVFLKVESKPIYIFFNKVGNSVSIDYQPSKWNGEKEIKITPISEGNTLLLFKDGDFSACPILVTVSKQTSPDEAI